MQELVSTLAMLGADFSVAKTYGEVEEEDDLTGMVTTANQHTGYSVTIRADDTEKSTVFKFDIDQGFEENEIVDGQATQD